MSFQNISESFITYLSEYGLIKIFKKIDASIESINLSLSRFYFFTLASMTTLLFMGLSLTLLVVLFISSWYAYSYPPGLSQALYAIAFIVFFLSSTLFILSYRKISETSRTGAKSFTHSYSMELQKLLQQQIASYKKDTEISHLDKRMEKMEDAIALIAESLNTPEHKGTRNSVQSIREI